MNQEKLIQQLKPMIEKSHRTLKAAKNLFGHGNYESASSRAYYAVFYTLEALLITKGLSFSKHSAVISAFSQHFIKEGFFPKDFGRKIRSLRKDREVGDYGYYEIIDKEKAKMDIKISDEIVRAIEEYIKSRFLKI